MCEKFICLIRVSISFDADLFANKSVDMHTCIRAVIMQYGDLAIVCVCVCVQYNMYLSCVYIVNVCLQQMKLLSCVCVHVYLRVHTYLIHVCTVL